MKINEQLYPSFDQEAIEQARYGEAELIAKLKSEFEEFIAHTREQLRRVSESLSEIDHAPIEPPVGIEVEEPNLASSSTVETEPTQDDPSEPLGPALSEIKVDSADSSQTNAEADDLDVWPDDVRHSSNQPEGKESASIDASFPESRPVSMEAGGNGTAQQDQDRKVPEAPRSSGGDDETDPFERLNAIKERLARQIEKS